MVLQLGNFGHLSKEPAVSGEVAEYGKPSVPRPFKLQPETLRSGR